MKPVAKIRQDLHLRAPLFQENRNRDNLVLANGLKKMYFMLSTFSPLTSTSLVEKNPKSFSTSQKLLCMTYLSQAGACDVKPLCVILLLTPDTRPNLYSWPGPQLYGRSTMRKS